VRRGGTRHRYARRGAGTAALCAACALAVSACATSRKVVLISNKEGTTFAIRVIPSSPADAAVRGPGGELATRQAADPVSIGTGKFVEVQAENGGSYEVVASVPGYPPLTQTILSEPALPSRVQFTFVERGRLPYGRVTTARRFRPGYARRYGVVVGINDYRDWSRLGGARRDAELVAGRLRELGFDDVYELYDRDATRSRILQLLGEELIRKTREEDLVVVFFAGHGQTETLPTGQTQGYIIPADGSRAGVFSTAISMDELRKLRERTLAKHMLYLMDSCYSGLILTRGAPPETGSDGQYAATATTYAAAQILTAGQDGQVAIEAGGMGLFTRFLLRALSGEADTDRDGAVTAMELATFVVGPVTRESNGQQTPQFGWIDAGIGNVVFPVR
jgi:hypothetical protein